MTDRPSLLVFGWGNPSRGDDALGPMFVERLQARTSPEVRARVEWLTDFQLQVEHALDLMGRDRVLFVDAGLECGTPFEVSVAAPRRERGLTTHALSPGAVLQVFHDVLGRDPPPCTQLAIRGERFVLGAPLSEAASVHLEHARSRST